MKQVEFSDQISKKLVNGALTQITLAISAGFRDQTQGHMLLLLAPCLFLLYTYHAPDIVTQLLQSLIINTALDMVETKETALSLLNMISVFLIGTAYDEENVSSTAQYIFAIQVSELYPIKTMLSLVVVLVLYTYIEHMLHLVPRLQNTFQMVLINMIQTYFLSILPPNTQFVCMVLLLYMLQPFITTSPRAMDIYNFLIMNSTSYLHWNGTPYWLQALVFTIISVIHCTDTTLQQLAQLLSIRMLQMTVITFLKQFAKTDPMLVYPVLIMSIQIFQTQIAAKTSAH